MNKEVIISGSMIPAYNLALEETLVRDCKRYDSILFLWQNENTIVVGRNQCVLSECNVAEAKKEGTQIVRRMTGGGCVFHDIGNLNYSFIEGKDTYNKTKKMEFICTCLKEMGIPAYVSGRNDILVNNKKISGNAFFTSDENVLHHGTILVNTDLNKMNRLLNVPQGKIKSKRMSSVKSRVANISEFFDITVNDIKKALAQKFGGQVLHEASIAHLVQSWEFMRNYEKYNSDLWNLDHVLDYEIYEKKDFDWGSVKVSLNIAGGELSGICVSSDSLFPDLIDEANRQLNRMIGKNQYDQIHKFDYPIKDSEEYVICEDIRNVIAITMERWEKQYGKL